MLSGGAMIGAMKDRKDRHSNHDRCAVASPVMAMVQ
jgi:hypothetical protein